MANKQRFYIWSMEGDGCVLAWRLLAEGYEVVLRIEDRFMRSNLDGIVEKTTARPRSSDIIIFDSVSKGTIASKLMEEGYNVIGSSELADKLELDRAYAESFWSQYEVQTPKTVSFDKIKDGIEFVSSRGGRWVFKPSSNADCAYTYCGLDEMDLVNMLLHFQSTIGDNVEYVLQEYVDGICVSTEGWFDGEQWIDGAWNGTIEKKELLVGDLGPKTGCAWNVVWSYAEMPKIAKEMHDKITVALVEDGYVGPWDMNCIVSREGEIYLLEATPRFGYDAIEAYAALLKQPLGETLIQLANQQTRLWPIDNGEVAAATRVVIAPYPYGGPEHECSGDIPIRYRHEDENYLWLTGVRKIKGKLLSAPTDGTIGIVTVVGSVGDIYSICNDLRERCRRVMVPNLYWRDDCGAGVMEQWYQLESLGFESPIEIKLNTASAISIGS